MVAHDSDQLEEFVEDIWYYSYDLKIVCPIKLILQLFFYLVYPKMNKYLQFILFANRI